MILIVAGQIGPSSSAPDAAGGSRVGEAWGGGAVAEGTDAGGGPEAPGSVDAVGASDGPGAGDATPPGV